MKYAISEIVFGLWSDAEALMGLAQAVGEDERRVRMALRDMPRPGAHPVEFAQWRDSCERLLGNAGQAIREIGNRIQWRLRKLEDDLRLRPRKPYKLTPKNMRAIHNWYKAKKKDRKPLKVLAQELGLSRQSVYTAIKLIETNWDEFEKMTNPDQQHYKE